MFPLTKSGWATGPAVRDRAMGEARGYRAEPKIGEGRGAFVSGEGLLLTNHHVAYGMIQYNISAKDN